MAWLVHELTCLSIRQTIFLSLCPHPILHFPLYFFLFSHYYNSFQLLQIPLISSVSLSHHLLSQFPFSLSLSLSLSPTLIVSRFSTHFSVPISQISQFPSTSFLNFTLSSFFKVTTPFLSPSLKSLSTTFQLSSLHFPPLHLSYPIKITFSLFNYCNIPITSTHFPLLHICNLALPLFLFQLTSFFNNDLHYGSLYVNATGWVSSYLPLLYLLPPRTGISHHQKSACHHA